jgi:phage terminase small subunit
MTERQGRFVVEYLKDGNATQAARRAGFSHKTAGQIGNRLLKDVQVKRAISEAREPALENAQMTMEGHLAELERLRELSKKAGQMSAAIAAETNRGKVAGYYVERQEISGNAGGPVAVEVVRRIVRAGA